MVRPNPLSFLVAAAMVVGCSDPGGIVTGSPFVTVLVDHESNVDYGAGFATPTVIPGASDKIDVVYGDFEQGTVKQAVCTSSCGDSASWTAVVIDSNGHDPSAARTASGLHAVYLRDATFPTQPLRYASCAGACPPGSSWSGTAVDSMSYAVSPALAADPSDGLHVVYGDYVGKRVRYAECLVNCLASASWASIDLRQLQAPLAVNSGEKQTAIAVAAGMIHVVYAAHLDGLVRYLSCTAACMNSASWQEVTIDSGQTFGTVSLALDAAGVLHLAYIAGPPRPVPNNGERWTVRYAACAAACTTRAGWTHGDLTTDAAWTGDQGVALSADASGILHLAYLLSQNATTSWSRDVAYAVCTVACTDSTHWLRALVGRNGAQAVGLAVNASNEPGLTEVASGSFWFTALK